VIRAIGIDSGDVLVRRRPAHHGERLREEDHARVGYPRARGRLVRLNRDAREGLGLEIDTSDRHVVKSRWDALEAVSTVGFGLA
jgi:hypothetical protein